MLLNSTGTVPASSEASKGKQRFRGSTASSALAPGSPTTRQAPPPPPPSSSTTTSASSSHHQHHQQQQQQRYLKRTASGGTGSGETQQRLANMVQDMKRFWKHRYSPRQRTNSEGTLLPHHHHHHHHHSSTGKSKGKAWHVEIPKRMMFYTLAVFLLLPLTLFYWKETHLAASSSTTRKENAVVESKIAGQQQHDVYPNWFADQQLPNSSGSGDTASSMDMNNNDENDNMESPLHPAVPQQREQPVLPLLRETNIETNVTEHDNNDMNAVELQPSNDKNNNSNNDTTGIALQIQADNGLANHQENDPSQEQDVVD
eukprot:scaffold1048_cov90-Amphora_coffeaeformis.AAC.13